LFRCFNCKNQYNENNNSKNLKIKIMGNLLYAIAVILVIGWAIGFIGLHAGGIIHILLVIALIAVILRVIKGSKPL
jgi:hypothetical protein